MLFDFLKKRNSPKIAVPPPVPPGPSAAPVPNQKVPRTWPADDTVLRFEHHFFSFDIKPHKSGYRLHLFQRIPPAKAYGPWDTREEQADLSSEQMQALNGYIKSCGILEVLERVKNSEFRDIETTPAHTERLHIPGFHFEDFYGSCYRLTQAPETQEKMDDLLIELLRLLDPSYASREIVFLELSHNGYRITLKGNKLIYRQYPLHPDVYGMKDVPADTFSDHTRKLTTQELAQIRAQLSGVDLFYLRYLTQDFPAPGAAPSSLTCRFAFCKGFRYRAYCAKPKQLDQVLNILLPYCKFPELPPPSWKTGNHPIIFFNKRRNQS